MSKNCVRLLKDKDADLAKKINQHVSRISKSEGHQLSSEDIKHAYVRGANTFMDEYQSTENDILEEAWKQFIAKYPDQAEKENDGPITNGITNGKEKSQDSNNKFTQDEFNRNRYFTPTVGVTLTAMSGRKYDGFYVGHVGATGQSTHPEGSMESAYAEALKFIKQPAKETYVGTNEDGDEVDANIGREWDSVYGRQRIVSVDKRDTGFGKLYDAKSLKDGSIRRYNEKALEDTIRRQEYQITPEFEKETANRIERENKRLDDEKKKEEKTKSELVTVNDFTKNFNPMQKGKVIALLSKNIRIDNDVDTLRNHIHKLIDTGEITSTREENKIKDVSRRQWNNMDQRQQYDHERKVKEGGKKTVYLIGGYDLGKTAYDYANYLIDNNPLTHLPESAPSAGDAVIAKKNQVFSDASEKLSSSSEMDDLKAQMGQAIGEVVSLLGGKMNMTEEEEAKLLPIMSKIFKIAAKMGYLSFKDASRYVMQQFRSLADKDTVDKIDINNLRGAFINSGGSYKEVGAYDSIEQLESDSSPFANDVAQQSEESQKPHADQQDAVAKTDAEQLKELNAALDKAEAEYASQGMVKNARTGDLIDSLKKQIANIEHPELLKALNNNADLTNDIAMAVSINAQDGWQSSDIKKRALKQALLNRLKSRGIVEEYAQRYLDKIMAALISKDTNGVADQDGVPLEAKQESARYALAQSLAAKLDKDGEITLKTLLAEGDKAFGGTQAIGAYSGKDAYDAMEVAVNLHLLHSEKPGFAEQNARWAKNKITELTNMIQALPTQTKRDAEMDEFQQFSTPPALSFMANWVANVSDSDTMLEPSAGTGDLAVWPQITGADIILNELSKRRLELLNNLFPKARVFNENAEQLNNVLPKDAVPTVIVMNPPFSSTAGRVHGQRDTMNGGKHIEQALLRLQDGGRLVAIVGSGMASDRSAFRKWWKEIEKKYNVRANIGISGKEYAKYGTTFDNQILVIDKNGATIEPVLTGSVESVAELPAILEGIKNDRQSIKTKSASDQSESGKDTQNQQDTIQPEKGTGGTGANNGGTGGGKAGNGKPTGAGTNGKQPKQKTGKGDATTDGNGSGGAVNGLLDENAYGDGRSGGDVAGGDNKQPELADRLDIKSGNQPKTKEAFTDSIFSNYSPQRLSVPGAKPHPGKLVQSSAMAAVEPPAPTYKPSLPKNIVQDGLLSIAQIESIVYAGQAHTELLPNGSRKGFFIGDGTGVGKGREISGIIMDNMQQGRKKALWVSFNEGLMNDAKRDYSGIGGDDSKIFFQGKTKAANQIVQKDGILFTSYSTLGSGQQRQANDLGQQAGQSRLQQIVDWLGADFDGVIAFDEAHSMGNAIAVRGKRGVKKPSKQALAGIALQQALPKARVVYISATGATEISNLGYAERLGLWGEGSPFANVTSFISEVSNGGVASMELLSRDMKALGMYISRSLSYDGVTYERLEHTLTPLQRDIYDELSGAWQIVLSNVNQALELTNAGSNGNAKSSAMSAFWGSHQRFFNQIITSMQTPSVIDDIQKQIDKGNVALIQIVNTNEAAQERNIAEAIANNEELEELDFTPRQMLTDYVRNGFPVAAFEQTVDENGNTIYLPVHDADGNPVFDREAIQLRDNLLETLKNIRVPENPLDAIISVFGTDAVAEVTGRGRRFVQTRDKNGELKVTEEKRNKTSSRADAEAFQDDKKKILIFSRSGGTGYSFHADNTAKNRRKRIHYILQPGWQADAAMQGLGRSHRTNQAIEPHYVLPTTDLKAQKRFVSSIARRMDQLGALTRGQRQATSQGLFTAADNLESEYASTAIYNFFVDLRSGNTELSYEEVTGQMGLNLSDSNGAFSTEKIPTIPQFLNRLLSLKYEMQNDVFDEFEKRLVEAVEYAKQNGTYDVGLQTLSAKNIVKTADEVAYEDEKTGAQTRYVELNVTNDIPYISWDEVNKAAKSFGEKGGFYVWEHGQNKGKVFFLKEIGERTDSKGNTTLRSRLYDIRADKVTYRDNTNEIKLGYRYGQVAGQGHQKITITRKLDLEEAQKLWQDRLTEAPKDETVKEYMLVGVILPIWDRIRGSSSIYRLQTDDGEQLLGKLMTSEDAKQTMKNLGIGSSAAKMPKEDQFKYIQKGSRAVLSNGWEITTATVNYAQRIEIKGNYISSAEEQLLEQQGAFMERINWQVRFFIPNDANGLDVFKRITESKPVVDLFDKSGEEVKFSKAATTQTIDQFADQTKRDLGLKSFVVVENNRGDIELSSLIVDKGDQKGGKGTAAMKKLTDYADQAGKRIVLSPGLPNDNHGTTSRARLVKFYQRFGFVESRGRNIDYAIGAGKMFRNPVSTAKKSQSMSKGTGSTVEQVKSWLPARVNKLVEAGNLKIVQNAADALVAQSFNAGGVEGFYNAKTDELFLVASNLNKGNIKSVLNHELYHRALATDKNLQEAVKSFNAGMQARFNLAANGNASDIENRAAKRVINANTPAKDQLEEFQAYMVTEYNRKPDGFTGAVKKIIQDFIAAIRVALLKAGVPLNNLTPADLNALAKQGSKLKQDGTKFSSDVKAKITEIRNKISAYESFINCLQS